MIDRTDERIRALMADYQTVISSPSGERVIAHIVKELGFWSNSTSPEMRGQAIRILELCGAFRSDTANLGAFKKLTRGVPVQED